MRLGDSDNVCELLGKGRTRQCSGCEWTRDLQSQVQRPNHNDSESHYCRIVIINNIIINTRQDFKTPE